MHVWKVYAHLHNLWLLLKIRMKMVVALTRRIGKVSWPTKSLKRIITPTSAIETWHDRDLKEMATSRWLALAYLT